MCMNFKKFNQLYSQLDKFLYTHLLLLLPILRTVRINLECRRNESIYWNIFVIIMGTFHLWLQTLMNPKNRKRKIDSAPEPSAPVPWENNLLINNKFGKLISFTTARYNSNLGPIGWFRGFGTWMLRE